MNTGPHPVSFARAELDRAGSRRAADLARVPDGRRARVGGIVIVRQRPGTAKGFVFITVEDETGFANAIVTPHRFERHRARSSSPPTRWSSRASCRTSDGVVTVKADRFEPLSGDPAHRRLTRLPLERIH